MSYRGQLSTGHRCRMLLWQPGACRCRAFESRLTLRVAHWWCVRARNFSNLLKSEFYAAGLIKLLVTRCFSSVFCFKSVEMGKQARLKKEKKAAAAANPHTVGSAVKAGDLDFSAPEDEYTGVCLPPQPASSSGASREFPLEAWQTVHAAAPPTRHARHDRQARLGFLAHHALPGGLYNHRPR